MISRKEKKEEKKKKRERHLFLSSFFGLVEGWETEEKKRCVRFSENSQLCQNGTTWTLGPWAIPCFLFTTPFNHSFIHSSMNACARVLVLPSFPGQPLSLLYRIGDGCSSGHGVSHPSGCFLSNGSLRNIDPVPCAFH